MANLKEYGIYKGEGRIHEEVIYSMALLYNVVNSEISTYLKDYNLTAGKLNILIAINHYGRGKGLPQVEISRHLIVTPSNITKMVDKLEKDELVERKALEGDRRVNIINVTKKGVDLLDSIWNDYNLKLKSLVGKISLEKQQKLASILTEWFEKLK
ncbi:MAG: MarR family transcriptional regulator [Candidatus Omnitrophica bacterium]|nr:MarR family transcriptional regulator [Candidatus Omnitrophota bacterium]